jgi:hypothetical protein
MSGPLATVFRHDVLQFEDWTDADYAIAEKIATLIEVGAAAYDEETGIVSSSTSKVLAALAAGELALADNALFAFCQFPLMDVRLCLVEEGIRAAVKVGDIYKYLSEPFGKPDLPTMEEFLEEVE